MHTFYQFGEKYVFFLVFFSIWLYFPPLGLYFCPPIPLRKKTAEKIEEKISLTTKKVIVSKWRVVCQLFDNTKLTNLLNYNIQAV